MRHYRDRQRDEGWTVRYHALTADPTMDRGGSFRELLASFDIDCTNPHFPSPHAPCCGAGGGMPLMQPEASRRMAGARVPGDGIAVMLDPRCAAHLRDSVGGEPATMLGFAEFIARYFTLEPAQSDA